MASPILVPQRGKQRRRASSGPSGAGLIAQGLDPVHAADVFAQHVPSVCAENVSSRPEMQTFTKEVGKAEDEYLPEGPPMSPLTRSYFTSGAFFDSRIDRTTDPRAGCLSDANDLVRMNPDQLDALKQMQPSRRGIDEHHGFQGNHIPLRELITDRELVCHNPSGDRGHAGELGDVRALPPWVPELVTYPVIFTTPYGLIGQATDDWIASLKRSLVGRKASSEAEARYRLLKFGPRKGSWNEFLFLASHHPPPDAIVRSGIPDLKATLPPA